MAPAAPLPTDLAKKLASIAERVIRAFIVAFVGVYVTALLAGDTSAVSDASFAQKAALAGIAAAAQLVLSIFGSGIGNTATPAILPARFDPATKRWTTEQGAKPPSSSRGVEFPR